ncbi:hypothetical protein TIFTF001_045784 [Ficus carica]|uniref:Uncharacterized protein n=1 Tax=Ficus carica TaxID=3494 RepID=A0AA87Z1S5_FICCA|nr:hypothetical protein TIFTF001_045784 [Ficus carica]
MLQSTACFCTRLGVITHTRRRFGPRWFVVAVGSAGSLSEGGGARSSLGTGVPSEFPPRQLNKTISRFSPSPSVSQDQDRDFTPISKATVQLGLRFDDDVASKRTAAAVRFPASLDGEDKVTVG